MNKEQKQQIVAELAETFSQTGNNFYIADIADMTVAQTNALRRKCFESNIQLRVVKNTLIRKALDSLQIEDPGFDTALKGASAVMTGPSATAPAKLIKEFRKGSKKPIMKAAYVEHSLYLGDDMLDTVLTLKSKEQLIGEIIGLLKSPMQNVIGGLQGGGQKIAGILKTLSEKEG